MNLNGEKTMLNLIKNKQLVWAVGAMVVIVVLAVAFTVRPSNQHLVSFDIKGTFAQFTAQAAKQKMDKIARADLAKEFAGAIKQGVQQYAVNHHAIVFVKGAVVSGAPNVTHDIQVLIAKIMVQKKQEEQVKQRHGLSSSSSESKQIKLVG